jgi:hypothetical protein
MTSETLEWQHVYRSTNCPVCKAKPGERCHGIQGTGKGHIQPNHPARTELFRKVEAELKPKVDPSAHLGHVGSE